MRLCSATKISTYSVFSNRRLGPCIRLHYVLNSSPQNFNFPDFFLKRGWVGSSSNYRFTQNSFTTLHLHLNSNSTYQRFHFHNLVAKMNDEERQIRNVYVFIFTCIPVWLFPATGRQCYSAAAQCYGGSGDERWAFGIRSGNMSYAIPSCPCLLLQPHLSKYH